MPQDLTLTRQRKNTNPDLKGQKLAQKQTRQQLSKSELHQKKVMDKLYGIYKSNPNEFIYNLANEISSNPKIYGQLSKNKLLFFYFCVAIQLSAGVINFANEVEKANRALNKKSATNPEAVKYSSSKILADDPDLALEIDEGLSDLSDIPDEYLPNVASLFNRAIEGVEFSLTSAIPYFKMAAKSAIQMAAPVASKAAIAAAFINPATRGAAKLAAGAEFLSSVSAAVPPPLNEIEKRYQELYNKKLEERTQEGIGIYNEAINGKSFELMRAVVKRDPLDKIQNLLDDLETDPNFRVFGYYYQTALMYAIATENEEAVKIILDHPRTDPNVPARSGETAFFYALQSKIPSVVKMFLENEKVDFGIKDIFGRTALSRFVYDILTDFGEQRYLLSLLISGGRELHDNGNMRMFVFDHHAESRWTGRDEKEILKILLESPKIDLEVTDKKGDSILMNVINMNKDIAYTKIILSSPRINPNLQRSNDGKTALIMAIEDNKKAEFELLLKDLRVDPNIKDYNGKTALHYAFEKRDINAIQTLLSNERTDPNLIFADGQEDAIKSIIADQQLLKIFSDDLRYDPKFLETFERKKAKNAELVKAAKEGNMEVTKRLLSDLEVDPNVEGDGNTPLVHAILKNDKEVVKSLLAHPKIDPNKFSKQVAGDISIVEFAERLGSPEIFDMILNHPKSKDTDAEGIEIIQAARNGDAKKVKELLADPKIDPYQSLKGLRGKDAFSSAIRCGHLEVVKMFLDSERFKVPGLTEAMHDAIIFKRHDILKLILENKKIKHNYSGFEYMLKINEAARTDNPEIVKIILDNPRLTEQDFSIKGPVGMIGFEGIHIAAARGNVEVMQIFLNDPRVNPNHINTKLTSSTQGYDSFPLLEAAKKGRFGVVKLLLSDSRVDPYLISYARDGRSKPPKLTAFTVFDILEKELKKERGDRSNPDGEYEEIHRILEERRSKDNEYLLKTGATAAIGAAALGYFVKKKYEYYLEEQRKEEQRRRMEEIEERLRQNQEIRRYEIIKNINGVFMYNSPTSHIRDFEKIPDQMSDEEKELQKTQILRIYSFFKLVLQNNFNSEDHRLLAPSESYDNDERLALLTKAIIDKKIFSKEEQKDISDYFYKVVHWAYFAKGVGQPFPRIPIVVYHNINRENFANQFNEENGYQFDRVLFALEIREILFEVLNREEINPMIQRYAQLSGIFEEQVKEVLELESQKIIEELTELPSQSPIRAQASSARRRLTGERGSDVS